MLREKHQLLEETEAEFGPSVIDRQLDLSVSETIGVVILEIYDNE